MKRDEEALSVLEACLSLCHADNAPIRRRALAQRGWLNFRAGRREQAFRDFEEAGRLGCVESKRMAVRCNPYAQLCQEIVFGILQAEQNKFYSI